MLLRARNELLDDRAGASDAQLFEQEGELLIVLRTERAPHVRGQRPQLLLERSDRFLPRLIVKLLVGVGRLPFVLRVGIQPRIHIGAQRGRDVIEHHGLEVRREMDFRRLEPREIAEGGVGQRGRSVLDRTGHAIPITSDLRELLERVEIERHLGNGAVGEHDTAVRRPRLDRDLGQPGRTGRLRLEGGVEAIHERLELFRRAVLGADFSDFATDGDRHAGRLGGAHETGDIHTHVVVETLLFGERLLGEIDQRGCIDVDVVEAGGNRLGHERLDRVHFGDRIDGELFVVDLEVITLNEHWSAIAFAQCGGENHRHIFVGALIGVGDLRARNFENEGAGLQRIGSTKDGAGGVVRERANVHRGHREAAALALPTCDVQLMDRGGTNTDGLPELPDEPAGEGALAFVPEDRLMHQRIHVRRGQDGSVMQLHAAAIHRNGTAKERRRGLRRIGHSCGGFCPARAGAGQGK